MLHPLTTGDDHKGHSEGSLYTLRYIFLVQGVLTMIPGVREQKRKRRQEGSEIQATQNRSIPRIFACVVKYYASLPRAFEVAAVLGARSHPRSIKRLFVPVQQQQQPVEHAVAGAERL